MTVELTRIANGVTVATHTMPHLESVAIGVWIGAGARSETASEHGVSHLLEHMAFKGTKRRTARDIAEAIEAVGGEMNAETSADHTTYYVRLLKGDLPLGIDVLGDLLTEPRFDPDELAREKHVIVQEIGAAHDAPEDHVFDMLQAAAYPGQPIGRSILGTPRSVRSHTPAGLRRFQKLHYCGPQTVLAAVGAVEHAAVVRLAETHLAGLAAHPPGAVQPAVYQGGESIETRALQEAHMLLAFAGPSFSDRSFHAAHILSAILGGGMASRLFQELRENRGLCYSVYTFYWPFTDSGLFGIQSATSEEDIQKLMPVLLDELERTTDGFTDAELRRAKAQLRSGLLMTLESPIARAGQIARQILVYGRPLEMSEMIASVERVSHGDLKELAASILSSAPTLAAIGPVASLPRSPDIASRLAGQPLAVGW
jgi:predicted Zn-dependent peptidase